MIFILVENLCLFILFYFIFSIGAWMILSLSFTPSFTLSHSLTHSLSHNISLSLSHPLSLSLSLTFTEAARYDHREERETEGGDDG